MASSTDIAAATLVSADTPVQDLPCMRPGQLGAAPAIDLQRVFLQSNPPRHLGGVDRYEAAELLRDFVPQTAHAEKAVLLREAQAAEADADGALEFKRAEGARVLVEAALCSRAGTLLKTNEVVVIPPIVQASVAPIAVLPGGSATPAASSGQAAREGQNAATAVAPVTSTQLPAAVQSGSASGGASSTPTATEGISASDRARAKAANDELVELVLGEDPTRSRERTTVAPATLGSPALVARNLDSRGIASIMYPFGQARQGLVWALAVLQILGLLGGGSNRVAVAVPTEEIVAEVEVLSPEWMERFAEDDRGCGQARMPYIWRPCGFGSNMNNLLHAWVYGIVVEGWSDVVVVVDDKQLLKLDCSLPSGGLESGGWGCIFSSMPHLCSFNSVEKWQAYMDSAGVSAEDRKEADRLAESLGQAWSGPISESFEGLGVDQRGARAVMTTLVWRYITPWVRRDVDEVTHVRETFQTSPFIAIHVRRGDLVRVHQSSVHSVESYLEEAVRVLKEDVNGTTVDAIKGIWVASDDTNVVDEVREKAGGYFPSVLVEDIVYVAGGVPGGVQTEKVTTYTNAQGYESLVYLMADIEQLVAADVFVGTCSSNIGRLVMVLRDGRGKDKKTATSLDIPWGPHRQRRLVLD